MKGKIKNVKLGEVLVNRKIITNEQLSEALIKLRSPENIERKALLGDVLVSLEYCTHDDIMDNMSKKTNVKVIDLNQNPINMQAANLISPEIALRYKALPIDFTENKEKLIVALKNPSDLIAIDDLSLLTGYAIQTVLVRNDQLDQAILKFSNMSTADDDAYDDEELIEEEDDEKMAQPAVQLINQVLNQAMNAEASDVHIEPQEKKIRIRFRIDGVLHEIMNQSIKLAPSISSRIKILSNMNIAEKRIPQDGRMTYKNKVKRADIRVASLPTVFGEKITMRLIDRTEKMLGLGDFNMPEKQLKGFTKAINTPYGFILITGPTGSGKSTTLYAALQELNSDDKNIITLEDPVERRVQGLNQIQTNERAGLTFSSGLRSILRSDPDILMIGEIRDHETAKIALESALTGHLVLSTLHTNSSAGVIPRLDDMDVEPYLTAAALVGIIAQRLLRKLCKHCKQEVIHKKEELQKKFPYYSFDDYGDEIPIYTIKGCANCSYTGYKGRIGVYEYLEVTDNIRELILKGGSIVAIEQMAVQEGMITLRNAGVQHIVDGLTSIEEYFRVIV